MFGLFKRRITENKENLIKTMTRIVEILNKENYSLHAEAVKRPLEYLIKDDIVNFEKYLDTAEIWGGAGSAWEIGQFSSRQIELEFEACFVQLIQLMRRCRIRITGVRAIEKLFMKDIKGR